ncbi:hypothetical protein NCC49_003761 [Naganishia albida]|nr:hypothetical protein NCC49_003761 [Naganishia albida]
MLEVPVEPIELSRQDSNTSNTETLVDKEGPPHIFTREEDPESLVLSAEAIRQWRRKRLIMIGVAVAVLVGTAIGVAVLVSSSDKDKKAREADKYRFQA